MDQDALFHFLTRDPSGVALVAFAMATYVAAVFSALSIVRQRRRRNSDALKKVVSEGMKSGILENVTDFVNVFKGVYSVGADDISYRSVLGRTLREYLVQLVSDSPADPAQTKKLKDSATSILEKIEEESPFADLPPAERNIISDIKRFVASGDVDATNQKLSELAGHIQARHNSLQNERQTNRWTIPLTVIGLVLSVVFGLISIYK